MGKERYENYLETGSPLNKADGLDEVIVNFEQNGTAVKGHFVPEQTFSFVQAMEKAFLRLSETYPEFAEYFKNGIPEQDPNGFIGSAWYLFQDLYENALPNTNEAAMADSGIEEFANEALNLPEEKKAEFVQKVKERPDAYRFMHTIGVEVLGAAIKERDMVSFGAQTGDNVNRKNDAMYHLARGLGAPNAFAQTESMEIRSGDRTVSGSFMKEPEGTVSVRDSGVMDRFKQRNNNPLMDHGALKGLADLQVLDYIAGARAVNFADVNFRFGENGKVNGVTQMTVGFSSCFARDPDMVPVCPEMLVMSKTVADAIRGMTRENFEALFAGDQLSAEGIEKAWDRLVGIRETLQKSEEHFKGAPEGQVERGFIRVIDDDGWDKIRIDELCRTPEHIARKPEDDFGHYESEQDFYDNIFYRARGIKSLLGDKLEARGELQNVKLDGVDKTKERKVEADLEEILEEIVQAEYGCTHEYRDLCETTERALRQYRTNLENPTPENQAAMQQSMDAVCMTAMVYLQHRGENYKNGPLTPRENAASKVLGFGYANASPQIGEKIETMMANGIMERPGLFNRVMDSISRFFGGKGTVEMDTYRRMHEAVTSGKLTAEQRLQGRLNLLRDELEGKPLAQGNERKLSEYSYVSLLAATVKNGMEGKVEENLDLLMKPEMVERYYLDHQGKPFDHMVEYYRENPVKGMEVLRATLQGGDYFGEKLPQKPMERGTEHENRREAEHENRREAEQNENRKARESKPMGGR